MPKMALTRNSQHLDILTIPDQGENSMHLFRRLTTFCFQNNLQTLFFPITIDSIYFDGGRFSYPIVDENSMKSWYVLIRMRRSLISCFMDLKCWCYLEDPFFEAYLDDRWNVIGVTSLIGKCGGSCMRSHVLQMFSAGLCWLYEA